MTDKLKEYPEKSYNTFTMKIIVMGTLPNDAKNVFFVGQMHEGIPKEEHPVAT